jgi:nucleoside-diphosphate-sugar epimerase
LRDDWAGLTHKDLDLTDQKAVDAFFDGPRFDVVIHCAVIGGSRLKEDGGDVCMKNLMMFENVARHLDKIGRLIYFSSGASRRGNPPSDPYGFSKWLIDKRIESMGPTVHSLCIWGCFGPGEPETRFSAICKRDRHVVIKKDRYFDFVDISEVRQRVGDLLHGGPKFVNLTSGPKLKLSEWAVKFGATFEVLEEGLDEAYTS